MLFLYFFSKMPGPLACHTPGGIHVKKKRLSSQAGEDLLVTKSVENG